MNEQAKRKPMNRDLNAHSLEEGVQDMIARVMTLARLLVMQSVAEDGPGANPAHNRRKKHGIENL